MQLLSSSMSSSGENGTATSAGTFDGTFSRRLFLFTTADEEIGICQLKATGADSLDLGVAFITHIDTFIYRRSRERDSMIHDNASMELIQCKIYNNNLHVVHLLTGGIKL